MIEGKTQLLADLRKVRAMIDIVHSFKGVRVAVLGDPMLDYYHFGHVDRISPEGPWPIFIEDRLDLRDGGAGNVVANLRALGCEPIALFPPAPYCIKHRYFVGTHCLFRTDRDQDYTGRHATLYSMTGEEPAAYVISDYAKGWCDEKACQQLIKHAKTRLCPVVVDPKGTDWGKYAGADIICPNQAEMIAHHDAWLWHILHKRGAEGMRLYGPPYEDELKEFPGQKVIGRDFTDFAAQAHHVFDVTGAGDTVTAVMAAALAVRCEMPIAAELANIAAGIAVGQVGTFPVSAAALLAEL